MCYVGYNFCFFLVLISIIEKLKINFGVIYLYIYVLKYFFNCGKNVYIEGEMNVFYCRGI